MKLFASGVPRGRMDPQPNVVQSPDGTRLWCLQADAKIENANHYSLFAPLCYGANKV